MLKKSLISIILSSQLVFSFPLGDNVVFDPTNLATAMEQLTALNQQIEASVKMLDQFNKVNKTLEQAEDLLFNSYEKLYNPKRQIQNIISNAQNTFRKAQRLIERIKNTKLEDVLFKNDTNPRWRSSILYDQEDPRWKELQRRYQESFSQSEAKRQQVNAEISEFLNLKTHLRKAFRKESIERISQIYQQYYMDDGELSSRLQEIEYLGNLMLESKDKETDLTKLAQITNQLIYKLADTLGKMYELNLEIANNQALKDLIKESEQIKEVAQIKDELDSLKGKKSYMELKAEAYRDCMKYNSLGIPIFGNNNVQACEQKFQELLQKNK